MSEQLNRSDLKEALDDNNKFLLSEFKHVVNFAIAENNKENLKPLREDVEALKSDRKALKWVASSISACVTFVGTVIGWFISK